MCVDKFNSILFLTLILFLNLPAFTQETSDPAELGDPAAAIAQQESSDNLTKERYTEEEFSQLPDEEKRNIYFNAPHLLPENFSFDKYQHILYPEFEETEN